MILLNILFVFINIIVIVIGYLFIKNKIEKKLVNKEILNKIKKEINAIIIQLNETTLNNVSLLEEKINNLDKKIILADKKTAGLKESLVRTNVNNFDSLLKKDQKNITYSPKKIIKQNERPTEKLEEYVNGMNNKIIEEEIKNLSAIEKANYLLKKGWEQKDVQKKVGLSSGELELLVNIGNTIG